MQHIVLMYVPYLWPEEPAPVPLSVTETLQPDTGLTLTLLSRERRMATYTENWQMCASNYIGCMVKVLRKNHTRSNLLQPWRLLFLLLVRDCHVGSQ